MGSTLLGEFIGSTLLDGFTGVYIIRRSYKGRHY